MLDPLRRIAIFAVILGLQISSRFAEAAVNAQNTYDALLNGVTADGIKSQKIPTTYDYVIVGGGAGGMLMAMRLTEDSRINVAVIEAGSLSEAFFTLQPGQLATSNFVDMTAPFVPAIDWLDFTLPLKVNAEVQHYPQGKMIGGSTARGFSAYASPKSYNSLHRLKSTYSYTRGTVGSYQKWATQVDDPAYSFEKFEPYLQRSAKFTPPNIQLRGENTSDIKFNTANWDAQGGPMQVAFPNYAAPFATWMKGALEETGAESAVDFVNGSLNGVQWLNVNVDPATQHRSYAADFFEECRSRTNLKVFSRTTATKVVFQGTRAQGILALDVDNNMIPFTARREVVLSAGVFRTPQLLMVSGIGPAETLQKFNIPVVSALESVGQNLSDRAFVGTTYQVNMDTTSQLFNAEKVAAANKSYFASPPTGILAGTVDITSFENVPPEFQGTLSSATKAALAAMPQDWPALQYLPVNGDLLLFRTTASKPPTPQAVVPSFGSIAAAVAAPQSKGSVTIRSANFSDPPVVDIGYLNNPADVELLMVAFKRSRMAWKTTAMQDALIGDEFWPGYGLVPDDDDDKIRAHVVDNIMPIWEASATCAMSSIPATGVVDSTARVFGVQDLRIVDASALPFGPPGHPVSSVLGMAELISERMKAEFGKDPTRKSASEVVVSAALGRPSNRALFGTVAFVFSVLLMVL